MAYPHVPYRWREFQTSANHKSVPTTCTSKYLLRQLSNYISILYCQAKGEGKYILTAIWELSLFVHTQWLAFHVYFLMTIFSQFKRLNQPLMTDLMAKQNLNGTPWAFESVWWPKHSLKHLSLNLKASNCFHPSDWLPGWLIGLHDCGSVRGECQCHRICCRQSHG